MPTFETDCIRVNPDEFVQACTERELKELVNYLVKENLVSEKIITPQHRGYDEQVFEESLEKLSGRWNMLSPDESEFISTIAKRF